MNKTHAVSKYDEKSGEKERFVAHELAPDDVSPHPYEGVDLAPVTLESLVTWDVSGHARRDQERLSSAAARIPAARHDTR